MKQIIDPFNYIIVGALKFIILAIKHIPITPTKYIISFNDNDVYCYYYEQNILKNRILLFNKISNTLR